MIYRSAEFLSRSDTTSDYNDFVTFLCIHFIISRKVDFLIVIERRLFLSFQEPTSPNRDLILCFPPTFKTLTFGNSNRYFIQKPSRSLFHFLIHLTGIPWSMYRFVIPSLAVFSQLTYNLQHRLLVQHQFSAFILLQYDKVIRFLFPFCSRRHLQA